MKIHEAIKPITINPRKRVLYLSGCSFRENYPEVISKTLEIFSKLDFNVSTITKEKCCGIPAYDIGEMKIFNALAKNNTEIINGFKPDLIVTSCPSCAYAYKNLYPKNGFVINTRVLHITEFLMENISYLKLRKEKNMDITFHDPCKLVNGLKKPTVFSDLLEKICKGNVAKPWRNGENTFCCGYGGSSICRIKPELADEIALERIKELMDFSNTIITACPSCKLAFENAKKSIDKEINILDIAEFVD